MRCAIGVQSKRRASSAALRLCSEANDYEAFLNWRETKLWEEIKRVTGAKEATDLELKGEEVEAQST